MKAKSAKEVLQAALYLYKEGKVGWCQKSKFTNFTGNSIITWKGDNPPLDTISACCLSGCLQLVECEPIKSETYLSNITVIAAEYIQSIINTSIPWWNDQSGRTKEDVIELLEKAIELVP